MTMRMDYRGRIITGLILGGMILHAGASGGTIPNRARQIQYLEDLTSISKAGPGRYPMTTLKDKTWKDWQKRTGELPPDFAMMESLPFLPDPMMLGSGDSATTITTLNQWQQKRDWIKEQYEYWIFGKVPPAPGNVVATIVEDRIDPEGARVQRIELRFGPESKGQMRFDLLLPPGPGPHPVYMTQWNHRDWAQLALRRGYIGCVYAGGDSLDDTNAYQALYPDYDFTQLMRRAWGASRIIDYLETRPEVNQDQIAITGHSRNGKQSLLATAFDDRIDAVISSSCGTGGIMPWRFSDPQYCNETLDAICSVANVWFVPRLRFFFGHEDRLPVDQNLLLASIAPRPLLMHYSYMEPQSNAWAAEQCYHSAKKAYDFLGSGENISMFAREGRHAVAARDVERCIDFLDNRFGRTNVSWETDLLFDFDFKAWNQARPDEAARAGEIERFELTGTETPADLEKLKPGIEKGLRWMLGDKPAGVKTAAAGPTVASRFDWMESVIPKPEVKNATSITIGPYTAMGDHMAGMIHWPVNDDLTTRIRPNGKVPVVIYLHPYAYAHGYAIGNEVRGKHSGTQQIFQQFVDAGFAVMAIDMFGFGTRMNEAKSFYQRQPGWSKMGKMVSDVSACVDALEAFDFVDQERVFVLGDTIGGTVALMAAALDKRIDGVVAVASVSPWRTSNSQYESIRVFSHQHGFMPRLGLFAEAPSGTPVDYGELMAMIAPRPLLVVNPQLNRHSDPENTARAMKVVESVYQTAGTGSNVFRVETPREINRITPEMLKGITRFLRDL